MFFENSREISLVIEPHGVGDLWDIHLSLTDQSGRLFKSQVSDELTCWDTSDLFHFPMELRSAESHFFCEFVDSEVWILHVFIDGLHHPFHEHVVVAFELHVLHFVFLLLCARIFTPQPSHIVDEVIDEEHVEDIYEYFRESESDNIDDALDELGGEYSEEEIRLVRIKFLSEQANWFVL